MTRQFERLHEEIAVMRSLGQPALFDGVTSIARRVGILRAYLLEHGLADAPAYANTRTPERTETWRERFQAMTGEML